MTDEVNLDRRTVLGTVGGLAAASTLGTAATGSAVADHDRPERAIRVDQVGYAADMHKTALVSSDLADLGSVSSFEVVDAETGESVHSGSLSEPFEDDWGFANKTSTGHTVKRADFSDLGESGTYRVVAGEYESYPFRIGEPAEVYGELLSDVCRLYTLKRANADVRDPVTGLDIGPGHEDDATATVAGPAEADYLTGDELLADEEPGDTVDITGGWYDAGDYGKYTITHAVTAAQLMLAYERNPGAFSTGQLALPESLGDPHAGTMPDLLVEVRNGLEFLSGMQRSDGSLFYINGGLDFGDMDLAPEDDDQERYVFGTSSAGTAMAVGTFAMAARVFEEYDPAFADEMLENAEAGWGYLIEHPETVWAMSEGQNAGTGPYWRESYEQQVERARRADEPYPLPKSLSEIEAAQEDAPDRYWAAAELLRTTGDERYDEYIREELPPYLNAGGSEIPLPGESGTYPAGPIGWDNPVSLGHIAYANTDGADADVAATAMQKRVYVTQRYRSGDWNRPQDAYTTGLYDYYWGCAGAGVSRAAQCSIGVDLAVDDYIGDQNGDWLLEPLHHVLGRSATNYSYVTGYGERSPDDPHDRIVESQGLLVPGMLVGGPHVSDLYAGGEAVYGGDSTVDHVDPGTPEGLGYYDDLGSYATNEWAIDYTAPLVMALAEVDGMAPVEAGDGVTQPDGEGSLRVIHASPDAPNVDVSVDGSTVLSDVPFGAVSDYLTVPAGERTVEITAAGDPSTVAFEGTVTVAAETSYTAIARGELSTESGAGSFEVGLRTDDRSEPEGARVTLFHASPDAPAVDVVTAGGTTLVSNLAFGDAATTAVPATEATVEVRPAAGGDPVGTYDLSFEAGETYTGLALGYLTPGDEPADEPFRLTGLPVVEEPEGEAGVRVIHASPDAPNVDVRVDGSVALADVPFGAVSDYLIVPAGERTVRITPAGDPDTTVIERGYTVEADTSYTVIAEGELSEEAGETAFGLDVTVDDRSDPGGRARVKLFHASPDAPAVDVAPAGGDPVVSGLEFGEVATTTVPAADLTLEVRPAGGSSAVASYDVAFEAGAVYTGVALGYLTPDDEPADEPLRVTGLPVAEADEPTLSLSLSDDEVPTGGTTTAQVVLSAAPDGLSGYEAELTVSDPSVATVEGVSHPDAFSISRSTVAADGASATLGAVDVGESDEPDGSVTDGAADAVLATVRLAGRSAGDVDLTVEPTRFDDDDGGSFTVEGGEADVSVTSLPPIDGTVPADLDGDGIHEDLNANGRVDYDDVVTYYQNREEATLTDNVAAYDLNGNDRIDLDDVVELFQEIDRS